MRSLALVLASLFLGACASLRSPSVEDRDLEAELAAITAGFRGDVGLYVRHLRSGRFAALRADETFPTASLVKVPILIGVFDELEHGALEYRKPLEYDEKRKYDGEDVLGRFRDKARIAICELVTLMCTFSDNSAGLWLQELAGGGTAINAWLDAHGFRATRVNSRTDGRKAAQQEFGWGQTSPREMAELLVMIHDGRAVSPAASAEMTRALARSYWTNEALSAFPPSIHVISKQGAVNRSRSEVLLVDAPHGAFVLCAITKNQADESWTHANAGFQLLRDVARAAWEHFEPDSPYPPVPGSERYW